MVSILDWLRRLFSRRTPPRARSNVKKMRKIKRSVAKGGRERKRSTAKKLSKRAKAAKPAARRKLVRIKVKKISRREARAGRLRRKGMRRRPIMRFTQTLKPRKKPKPQKATGKPSEKQIQKSPSPIFSLPKISFPSIGRPSGLGPAATARVTVPSLAKPSKQPAVHKLPQEITREVIVSDIMVKNVYKVKVDDTLSFVVRLFADKGISGAPVLHDNSFVGVISETDILKVMGAKDLLSIGGLGLKRLGEIKVEQVMNRNSVTVNEYTTLAHAADLMNKYDVMRLPVLDERRNVVGIITRTDIIRGISKEILFRLLRKKPEDLEKIRLRIDTDIDEILRIVDRRGLIGIDEIQKKLNIPSDKIEEWGKVLEKHDLVEVFYPPIGKPELRKKPK